jgi:hypothetical protein
MWVVSVIVGIVATAVIWFFGNIDSKESVGASTHFFKRYRTGLGELDQTRKQLIQLLDAVSKSNNGTILKSFEKLVSDFERILLRFRDLPRFSTDLKTLDSILKLVREIKQRGSEMQLHLAELLSHQSPTSSEKMSAKGCYFCSSPPVRTALKSTKVKIDAKVVTVDGCETCRTALKNGKKIKVLFFQKDGQQVHWSDLDEYRPSAEYFSINAGKASKSEDAKPVLGLIYSKIEKELDNEGSDEPSN